MEFVHIGVPTTEIKENEIYLAPLKVFVTVADNHEYKFEYLRYESGTPLPIEMQHQPHVAIKLSLIHISEPTRLREGSRMPSSA